MHACAHKRAAHARLTLTWNGHTYNHSKWENDDVQYLQDVAYSSFCIDGAQATRHSERVTKGEAKVLKSRSLQVPKTL